MSIALLKDFNKPSWINMSENRETFFSITEVLLIILQNFEKMTSHELFEYCKEKGMWKSEGSDNSYEFNIFKYVTFMPAK